VIQEDKLIERAQEGDQEAFCLLARSYQRRIYALALHYTRDPHEAEDLSQEVWMKAYWAIGDLRRRGGLLYLAAPDHGQHVSQPSTGDEVGGNNRVIVLAHQLWQRRYGGEGGVIGQTVSLNQVPYTVIGVLPPGALLSDETMFLIPFVIDVDSDTVKWVRGYHRCGVIGRVAPGRTFTG
jgi:hypothetical protein